MKYLLKKDKEKRKGFISNELIYIVLKSIIISNNLNIFLREYSWLKISKLSKKYSIIRIKNRCIITNRSRFIIIKYKISRLEFKSLVKFSNINGVYKKYW